MRDDDVIDQIAGQDCERLLLFAHRAGGTAGLGELARLVDGNVRYARELAAELAGLGLGSSGNYDNAIDLNGRGRKIAAKIEDSLDHGWRRDDQTRRWVLETARDSHARFTAKNLADQWGGTERARSIEEIRRAIDVLTEQQMIELLPRAQTPIITGITQQGRDALERTFVVRAVPAPVMVVNDHSRTVNQSGGTIIGNQMGDHATQHNTVTLHDSPEEIRAVLQLALGHADELPDQIADEVRDLINEAIAETGKEKPKKGFLRKLAERIVLAAVPAAATAAGSAILTAMGSLLS